MLPFRTVQVAALLLLQAAGLAAQQPVDWDYGRVLVSRDALGQLLQRLEATAASTGYSDRLRAQARRNADAVRSRLSNGDFVPGDRILLGVEGERELSDTFTVDAGPSLNLPVIGAIPLNGVLRSELETHLRQRIGRFIVNPLVHAKPLVRLTLLGAVNRPGFYTFPSGILLTDAITAAGGPTSSARVDRMRIERGKERLWEGEDLQEALVQGRTLDELNLRAGDLIQVPAKGGGIGGSGFQGTVRTVSILLSLPLAVYGLTQLIK